MTVTAQVPVSGPYTADGVNRSWAFTFKITNVAHMSLLVTDADGSNPVVVTSGFTIADGYLNQDAGGYITYPVAPVPELASGKKLWAYRSAPYEQQSRIGNQGGFFPETHERAFDAATMQIQQLAERISRAVVVPLGSPLDPDDVIEDLAGYAEAAEQAAADADADRIATEAAMNATLAAIAALGGPMVFQGNWDASAGSFPGTVNRKKGWTYIVTVAGTVDGQPFEVNDRLVALVDNASTSTYAGQWYRMDADLVQSVAGLQGTISAVDLRNALAVGVRVADRTALKALDTTKDTVAFLMEGGRGGVFHWTAGNYGTRIAADTQEGLYVKANAVAATAGAWVRQYSGPMSIFWFGATGDGVALDDAAFAGMMAVSGGWNVLPKGRFRFADAYVVDLDTVTNFGLVGAGETLTDVIYTGTGTFLTLQRGGLVGALAAHCGVLIDGITFRPTTTHQARCIKIELEDGAPSVGSYEALLRRISNCVFMGEGVGSGIGAVWLNCIEWYNAAYSITENVFYRGLSGLGTMLLFSGTRSAVDHTVRNIKSISCEKIVEVTNEVVEGIFIDTISGVSVKYGVYWTGTTPSPLLVVNSGHLNIIDGGAAIYLRDVTSPVISNLNIYLNGTSIGFDYDNDAVYAMCAQWSNCSINGITAVAGKTGVKLGAGVRFAAVGGLSMTALENGINVVAGATEVKLLPSIDMAGVTNELIGSTIGVVNWMKQREKLTANLSLYVRTDGTDSTSLTHGRVNSAAGAFLTLQAAWNYVADKLDLNGFDVTINVAAGTYAGGVTASRPFVGRGNVTFTGDVATPSNVTVGVFILSGGVQLRAGGLNFSKGAQTACLRISDCAKFSASALNRFSSTSGGHHVLVERNGIYELGANNEEVQGTVGGSHYYAIENGVIDITGGGDGTMSGTFTCGSYVSALLGGQVYALGNTYSGTVTGARYIVSPGGTILTNGGGTSYFPGSTPGTARGGYYDNWSGLTVPVTKTADFTLAESEDYIINNKAGSACVATLPAASAYFGRSVVMKTIVAFAINSASANVVPLAGGAAGTAIVSGTAGRWVRLVSDGTNWVIMEGVP